MENYITTFGTVFFAGLSAVFAGISAWLLYLEYRRNNPKIKVKMLWAIIGISGGTRELTQLRIENHGRRKVIISNWSFLTSEGKNFILFEDSDIFFQRVKFPYILDEQGICNISLDKILLEETIKDENVKLSRLDFSDTIGNVYSYKLKKKYWKDLM